MTNTKFAQKLAETLGDNFFLCDMFDQEELFELQDKVAKLIVKASNEGCGIATAMVKKLPHTFTTS
tara:strand:- start:2919 stop:3116 length:198 start_codon:yes stop_codon:yes gene_type:complete